MQNVYPPLVQQKLWSATMSHSSSEGESVQSLMISPWPLVERSEIKWNTEINSDMFCSIPFPFSANKYFTPAFSGWINMSHSWHLQAFYWILSWRKGIINMFLIFETLKEKLLLNFFERQVSTSMITSYQSCSVSFCSTVVVACCWTNGMRSAFKVKI